MRMKPSDIPQITQERAHALMAEHGIGGSRMAILGLRGYFRDTMGQPGQNDRGIYDDAIIVVSSNAFATFNANTDPSYFRTAIAVLTEGVWKYRIGTHGLNRPKEKQYTALVQADEVTVHRDGGKYDTGWFGINIHRGGYTTTSSLGCQTIFPDQWAVFISLVEQEMRRENVQVLPYLLMTYQG